MLEGAKPEEVDKAGLVGTGMKLKKGDCKAFWDATRFTAIVQKF